MNVCLAIGGPRVQTIAQGGEGETGSGRVPGERLWQSVGWRVQTIAQDGWGETGLRLGHRRHDDDAVALYVHHRRISVTQLAFHQLSGDRRLEVLLNQPL
ncbi:MAG: hypothetical protein K0S79_2628 [Nitrospira sp.]|nr:hypothetical protein [Nitrospira sp.]